MFYLKCADCLCDIEDCNKVNLTYMYFYYEINLI